MGLGFRGGVLLSLEIHEEPSPFERLFKKKIIIIIVEQVQKTNLMLFYVVFDLQHWFTYNAVLFSI